MDNGASRQGANSNQLVSHHWVSQKGRTSWQSPVADLKGEKEASMHGREILHSTYNFAQVGLMQKLSKPQNDTLPTILRGKG